MSISHLLEDFGAYVEGTPVSLTDVSLEEQRLAAFEKGYQAGWDDAVKAETEDSRRISTDFAQNLQDLSFTYQEAHSAVLQSLRPLLEQMVGTVLPALVQKTLGLWITELLQELAEEHGAQPIELVTAPANATALESLLGEAAPMSISILEEPTLTEGQVYIRFGSQEREIDMDDVLSAINRTVTGFFEENQRNTA